MQEKEFSSKHFNSKSFKIILELIFKNNIFIYDNKYFVQKIGLPMGCKCGPTLANLYLYILEKEWVTNHNPLVYERFIDDICCVTKTPLDIENLKENFGYLKINIENSDQINFLDLLISFNPEYGRFETNLYNKPTNTYSYLLHSSNHPSHIFKNIPKALFIRIRRICSNDFDNIFHSKKSYSSTI